MLRSDQQIVSPVEFLVTHEPGTGKIEVSGADGTSVGGGGDQHTSNLDAAVELLTKVYLANGSGELLAINLKGVDQPALATAFSALSRVLPAEVLTYKGDQHHAVRMSFGNFAVCARRSADDGLRAGETQRTEETLNSGLIDQDHAVVTVDGTRYGIPFDTLEARLLCRVLQTVERTMPVGKGMIFLDRILPEVWKIIPDAEKRLYKTHLRNPSGGPVKPDKLGRTPVIDRKIEGIIDYALRIMGVSRRGATGNVKEVTARSLRIDVSQAPLEPGSDLILVCPPGTPNEVFIKDSPEYSVSAEDIEMAALALEYASSRDRVVLSPEEAITMVEFFMPREGKVALLRHMRNSGIEQDFTSVMQRLEQICVRSLGLTSYEETSGEMVIHGHAWKGSTKKVRQVGGNLPGSTKASLGETTNWRLLHPTQPPQD